MGRKNLVDVFRGDGNQRTPPHLEDHQSQRILEEVNRQRILVASISHELRSPLQAMMRYAALLKTETGGRDLQKAHIERLQRNGRHLLEILNDVLAISRAEPGALPITSSERRLGAAIQNGLADVEPQAVARGVSLTNAVPALPQTWPTSERRVA